MANYALKKRPSFSLEDLRAACLDCETLPEKLVQELEQSVGGKYHGHERSDFGVVTIYLSHPRSCALKIHQTYRVDTAWEWNCRTVSTALLDVNKAGIPLSLDIYPKLVTRR